MVAIQLTSGRQKKLLTMKTKVKSTTIEGFKAVEFMREARDKISVDIQDMNFEEIKKYFEKRKNEKKAQSEE